ncbi:MAG TPA: L-histidine N(alpha)-methyltransferase [Balneolaceae bacterium]|nr:L-histidine N(alpha)-methyltransferase [Balneolaceae bacterium]
MDNQITVSRQAMLDEVLEGLHQTKKYLPSKFFYDERGSELFEQITRLDEYYPTRTEKNILENNIDEIANYIGPDAMLVELGSGSSRKTRLLLNRLSLKAYIPVDISEEYLLKVVNQLRRDYPRISIIPVFADYTSHFKLPTMGGDYQKQVVFFPGSTIGNFRPERARSFLEIIASITDDHSGMLIGVDLKKDKAVLEAAYNDEQGITADFNKNMLVRLNRELEANFDVEKFRHRAFYNEDEGRIEMHLVSTEKQQVHIDGEDIYLEEEESIHTENSYKYSLEDFQALVSDWYSVKKVWTDEKDYFSLQYLSKK